MALPMCISYVGLSLFIFKVGVILLRFMRLYAYNLTSFWTSLNRSSDRGCPKFQQVKVGDRGWGYSCG